MASRDIIFVFSACILFVNSAYLPFEDRPKDRLARSPHCWSCEQEYGYPPPNFYGFHHHPNFRSQQWSGLSKGPDGDQQVFSGAAASAGEGSQSSSDSQAFSLASAGAGESKGQVQEANPLKNSYSVKRNQETYFNANDQQQLGTKDSMKQNVDQDTQQAKVDRDGGNRENFQQSSVQSQTHTFVPGYDTNGQNIETLGHGAYGKGNSGQQYEIEQQQVKHDGRGSDLQQGKLNSGAPSQYQTQFINHEQRPTYTDKNNGNGRLTDSTGSNLNDQQNQNSQNYAKGGYNEKVQQSEVQQEHPERSGGNIRDSNGQNHINRRYMDNANHFGMQQNRRPDVKGNEQQVETSLSQSQASSGGYGNQGQFKQGYNSGNMEGQQNLASSNGYSDRGQFKQGYNGGNMQEQQNKASSSGYGHPGHFKHNYNSENMLGQQNAAGSSSYNDRGQYKQRYNEENAQEQNSHDTLSGALSLASQGLEASQKLPENGCTNCEGKGSIAYSNAKSRSGSAVALSIGG